MCQQAFFAFVTSMRRKQRSCINPVIKTLLEEAEDVGASCRPEGYSSSAISIGTQGMGLASTSSPALTKPVRA